MAEPRRAKAWYGDAFEFEGEVVFHPPARFQFAFPHSKGEPWWLTDGYGYSREVSPLVWIYYRTTSRFRTLSPETQDTQGV